MEARRWSRVDVLTFARREEEWNPIIPELQRMAKDRVFGDLQLNVYTVRKVVIFLAPAIVLNEQHIREIWTGFCNLKQQVPNLGRPGRVQSD